MEFQLIRPDGTLLFDYIRSPTASAEPLQRAMRRADGSVTVFVDGDLAYSKETGFAYVLGLPPSFGSVSPPWIWRSRESGGDWVIVAQWPEI